MSFAWPHLLWLLLVPAGLFAWECSHRRRVAVAPRPKILRAEAGLRSLKLSPFTATPAASSSRPRWWLWLGLTCCVVALARPQWGRIEEPVFEQSREVLLAVDLSRSMLTEDVRPSRLDRAKLLIRSLLENLAGERVGLVVFSGTAFLQSPLSSDYEILVEFLPALGPDFLPEGGTNYRALIDTSLAAFGNVANADRYLMVLSDGEATDDDWRSQLPALKEKGIRVVGLGVGTPGGSMIPDGSGGFVKDERGAVVVSKLESGTLEELALGTDGAYRDASSWVDLAALLQETVEAGQKGEFVETNTVRLVERFQWPLALGLWLLLVSFCYEFPVRARPRTITVRPEPPVLPPTGGATPAASGAKPAGTVAAATVALLIALMLPPPASAQAIVAPDAASAPEDSPSAALTKVVGRLSAAPAHTGGDWAEFARETVLWGRQLRDGMQPVPEGPVRDALGAVDLGKGLDAKAADWPKLREELEALLKKPEEEKNDDQQQQDNQDQDQNKDQQQQDQQQAPDQKQSKQDQQQKQDQQNEEQNSKPEDQKPPGESAFGDMNEKQETPPPPPPPPSPEDTQQVGGAEKKEAGAEPEDPSLALPLQKLDQLRNQDSPAQLFQLMEGERTAPKKPAKDY